MYASRQMTLTHRNRFLSNFSVENSHSRLGKSMSSTEFGNQAVTLDTADHIPARSCLKKQLWFPFPPLLPCSWQGLRSWHNISIGSTQSSSREKLNDELLKPANHFSQNILRNMVLDNLLLKLKNYLSTSMVS